MFLYSIIFALLYLPAHASMSTTTSGDPFLQEVMPESQPAVDRLRIFRLPPQQLIRLSDVHVLALDALQGAVLRVVERLQHVQQALPAGHLDGGVLNLNFQPRHLLEDLLRFAALAVLRRTLRARSAPEGRRLSVSKGAGRALHRQIGVGRVRSKKMSIGVGLALARPISEGSG